MMTAWGCDAPGLIYGGVWRDDEGTVYGQCPLKFIPKSIYQFLQIYDYYKQFPSAPMPDYDRVSVRLLSAWRYLDSKIHLYQKEVRAHER